MNILKNTDIQNLISKNNSYFLLAVILLFCAAKVKASEEHSLNGPWQIIFDLKNQGRSRNWQVKENFDNNYNLRDITVPSCWETIEQDYEGVGWYGKEFRVPGEWKNKTIRIHFGAVNYRAEVWINGEPAGYHDGGYTPFEFEIEDLLYTDKENFLAVRVTGPIVNKDIEIDGFGRDDTPHWRGAITGGIWQGVKLIATDRIYIKDVFIEPDIHSNSARVQVTLQNSGTARQEVNAGLTIFPKEEPEVKTSGKSQMFSFDPGESNFSITLPVKNARYWSPDDPFLYKLNLKLSISGKVADEKTIHFGMREFTLINDDFYLNGKKIYLKTGFWEGFYPNTLAFPENEEILRKEFKLAKEIGFNCLRPWRKQVPSITLDLADEVGMLIIASPAIECMGQWPTATPFIESRIFNEFTGLVQRDRNHASVVMWELYNEIHRKSVGRLKHKTAIMVRNLDPSRLIIDESGGWYGGSHVYLPYSFQPLTVNEIHSYKAAPVHSSTYNDFKNLGKPDEELVKLGSKPGGGRNKIVPGRLLFISEIGFGGLPDLDSNMVQYEKDGNPLTPDYRYTKRLQVSFEKALSEMNITDIFPSVSDFCQATQEIQAIGNKIQLEAVRINPEVDGYCVHAFTDGDWVLGAGILDIFRDKKRTFNTIKEVNQPLYLAVRSEKQNLYTGENLVLNVTSVNEREPQRGNLFITIIDGEGQSAFEYKKQITIPSGISAIFSMNNNISIKPGSYTVNARFSAENQTESENSYPLWIYAREHTVSDVRLTLVNPQGKLQQFIKDSGLNYSEPDFKETGQKQVIVVGRIDTSSTGSRDVLLKTIEYVKNGGTAIYLNALNVNPRGNNFAVEKSGFLPFELTVRNATGHWISVSHAIKPHPVFDGLPSGGLMGQEYQNVCAVKTFTDHKEQSVPVVCSVSWDIGIPEKWNYLGPTEAWWGSDLAVIPFGKGRVIISALRLVENLGTDPVADKILLNLINWAHGSI